MTDEEKKLRQQEATRRWRAKYPERDLLSQRKHDAKPERKAAKRKRMADWRKANPEKNKEIYLRSYRNNYDKIKEKRNQRHKHQYHNDPEWRLKYEKWQADYREKNRKICFCCNKKLEKNRIKYCLDCFRFEYAKLQSDYRKNNTDILNKKGKQRYEAHRDSLTDHYIGRRILGLKDWRTLPPKTIHIKRLIIKIKRELKKQKP